MTQQKHDDGAPAPKPRRTRRLLFPLGALALLAVAGLCGTGLAWMLRPPDVSEEKPTGPLAHYFQGWDDPKPDLVLVVSAEQHGYLLPCGCSSPQVGGLERRYNLIQMLKGRGWPVVAVDPGNVPQTEAPSAPVALPNVEGLIKYQYAMRAMKLMGYTAVGIGDHEAAMPLSGALDSLLTLSDPTPTVVTADLMDRDAKYPGETKAWQQADPVKGTDLRVGVTAAVGPSVYDKIKKRDPKARFADSEQALRAVVNEMEAAKIDLPVLLYMGSISTGRNGAPAEALACAEAFPQFPLIVGLDDGDLARAAPLWANGKKTMLISLGHKGKAVGVVGVFRKPGRPPELRYQMVEMSEDFKTPKAQQAAQPVLKLLNEFTKELKDENYLAKVPPATHPNQAGKDPMPKYVGTERCTGCHVSAGKVWEGTPHSHAYKTLVEDPEPPFDRQYDPECVVCHTVGFGYKSGFRSDKETPKLLNVGCESCHGPGSLHANDANNAKFRAEMNPWKAPPNEDDKHKTDRIRRLDDMCQMCHDPENDVHWGEGAGTQTGFERHWPKIQHPTPPGEKQEAAAP